ncbi:MAG: class I SAM-dependent methyltransferase [Desulfuromusa sp.]|nr:class I SAM-dependent methyltransferase [Desulfuromusa sp.]
MIDETFDYPEYLAIKQAIDDRSLNQSVWQALAASLKSQVGSHGFKILEIGAGTGSMIIRLLDAGLLDHCQYFAVELEPGFARVAENELSVWAGAHGYRMAVIGLSSWVLKKNEQVIEIQWITADILEIPSDFDSGYFDLLIGHAIIDLLPVPECMPGLLNLVQPRGSYYFSLNFAGVTSFSPSHSRDFEITEAYHRDMDKRFPGIAWRASQTGQVMGSWLKEQGHLVVAEGDSNWQLSSAPTPSAADNRFIGNILDTMAKALAGLDGLEDWLRLRRQQAASGNLLFFAANCDYFGRIDLLDTPQGKQSDKQNNRIA